MHPSTCGLIYDTCQSCKTFTSGRRRAALESAVFADSSLSRAADEPRTICHLTLAAAPQTAADAETQARVGGSGGGGARRPVSVKEYRINHKHLLCLESIVSAPVVQVVAHTAYNKREDLHICQGLLEACRLSPARGETQKRINICHTRGFLAKRNE